MRSLRRLDVDGNATNRERFCIPVLPIFPRFFKQILFLFLLYSFPFFCISSFFLNCLFKEGRGKRGGRCIQGQCKCLRLVNGESRANVSKQSTAVTHSHGEMHINTCGQGGGKRQWQKRKQSWGDPHAGDWCTNTHARATAPARRAI